MTSNLGDLPLGSPVAAGTAATLATSRNIDGQAFDGSANITVIAPGTHAATSKATPVDADELPLVDSAASNVLKKLTWANLKATLKTYFDTLYTAIGASAPPSGAAGGDLTGTYPNPTLGSGAFGTPAVVLGTAAAAGASSDAVRTDATIVAFDATSPTTQAFGDAAAVGTAAVAARRDHKHAMPSVATNALVLGTAAAAGSAVTTLRSDDTIAAFDATVPSTQAMGDAAATGSAAFAARRDHKHAMPSFATNAVVLGSAAAAGAATTPMRSNDTIAAFDTTAPVTQAFGDAAAVGSAAFAARRDHVHGMPASPAGGLAVFGDGSDGAVTFDGTTTILGIVPSPSSAVNGVYTLARDIFLANPSALNSGISIITNGFRIFCQGTFTNNGTVKWNGNAAAANVAGAALGTSTGSINASTSIGKAGATGGAGAGTNGGNSATNSFGGAGGNGGTAGANGGGTGGTVTAPTVGRGTLRAAPYVFLSTYVADGNQLLPFGGASGAAGGGDGGASGGGGGGAGVVVLSVKVFAGTGAIQARGGTGGTPGTGNRGGGGGGGGGAVFVISSSVSAGAISGQTIDANGGTKGSPTGTGTDNATNGSGGTVVLIPN